MKIMKSEKLNILILEGYYKKIASTVFDHLNSFKKYSKHNIIRYSIISGLPILAFNLNNFDVIVVHYTLSLFNESHFTLKILDKLKNFKGLKLVFIQDEYRQVNKVIEKINYIGFNILFTCVSDSEVEKVYPKNVLPNLKKINTLTGYVAEDLLRIKPKSYAKRKFDIVYRARKLPMWLGKIGQEKWQIAVNFLKHIQDLNLKHDIKYQEEERIYGKKWIKFLNNSKAALGVESGSGIFDFTGNIQKDVEAYINHIPNATYEEVEGKFFPNLDGKIYLNQISPRCFECAALKTLMILFEGKYSGILEPWRHYVPLKKDFSNINQVVQVIKNHSIWSRITQIAYEEIALNIAYSYKKFIENFDATIMREINTKNLSNKCSVLQFSIIKFNIILTKLFIISINNNLKNLGNIAQKFLPEILYSRIKKAYILIFQTVGA